MEAPQAAGGARHPAPPLRLHSNGSARSHGNETRGGRGRRGGAALGSSEPTRWSLGGVRPRLRPRGSGGVTSTRGSGCPHPVPITSPSRPPPRAFPDASPRLGPIRVPFPFVPICALPSPSLCVPSRVPVSERPIPHACPHVSPPRVSPPPLSTWGSAWPHLHCKPRLFPLSPAPFLIAPPLHVLTHHHIRSSGLLPSDWGPWGGDGGRVPPPFPSLPPGPPHT